MNPRKYSQIEKALQVLDSSDTNAILKGDHYLLFCFKKTERITAALYLLTALFPDAEPLKWRLRERGSLLLKDILSFKGHSAVVGHAFVSELSASLVYIISLLDVAYISDLLSGMNFSLLTKEIEGLIEAVEKGGSLRHTPLTGPYLDAAFFGLPHTLFAEGRTSAEKHPTAELDEPSLSSLSELEQLTVSQKDTPHKGHQRDVLYADSSGKRQKVETSQTVPVQKKPSRIISDSLRKQREHLIFELLRRQGTAMIKDFSGVITGCSEKTIQRQLLDLVHTDVLKKEGERRWSRYSLAEKGPGGGQSVSGAVGLPNQP